MGQKLREPRNLVESNNRAGKLYNLIVGPSVGAEIELTVLHFIYSLIEEAFVVHMHTELLICSLAQALDQRSAQFMRIELSYWHRD